MLRMDPSVSSLLPAVARGDIAAFDRPFIEMGNRLVAKSMDDRVGVLVAIVLAEGFEMVEMLWARSWQRYFPPKPAPEGAKLPKGMRGNKAGG